MNARDELADLIEDAIEDACYAADRLSISSLSYAVTRDATDAILDAGYRKPRTITTVEELDAVANGTVILSDEGGVMEKDFGWWRPTGSRDVMESADVALPAAVIHEPAA